jgi:hypothetical protein
MRTALAVAMLAVLPLRAADDPYAMTKIKYDALGKHVVANKGKVVVVEFWYFT